ncbi:DUF1351 domain-containing protein [Ruminococcus sp.]|uniref:DUF1351 domain-containing protein n=1 Tax=Ruminococcus sp. TaxID=41978 RepID=UPI001B3FC920|nr:DUF1351 domain-containing protein [Ruminococcus sp.]MBP5430804.1 DUF1351 domain-containing protein [Ruminococcus sp.]
MELQLKTAEINLPQEIANLEALKAELAPKLEYYNNLVVTADSIKAAKNDKANLNKLKTAIEDQRKAAKRQYLEPYNILEAQCKEVTALIDAPIEAIDKQLKVFDEIEKNEKFTELNSAFAAFEAPDWITINDVLNPKWENKTQKADALKTEMKANIDKLLSDYAQLEKLYENFPHLLAILDMFKNEKDFSQTMVYAKKLEYEYNREQELKAQLLKVAQEAQNEPEAAAPANDVITPEPEQTAAPVESEQAQKIIIGRFEVAGTAEQIKALGNFMKSNGIKFSIIKD